MRCYYCEEEKDPGDFVGVWNIGFGDSGICEECAEDFGREDLEMICAFVAFMVQGKQEEIERARMGFH